MKIKYMVVWSTDPNRDDACSGYGEFVRISDARNYARMIERDIPGAKVTLNQSVSGLTLATAEAEGGTDSGVSPDSKSSVPGE